MKQVTQPLYQHTWFAFPQSCTTFTRYAVCKKIALFHLVTSPRVFYIIIGGGRITHSIREKSWLTTLRLYHNITLTMEDHVRRHFLSHFYPREQKTVEEVEFFRCYRVSIIDFGKIPVIDVSIC